MIINILVKVFSIILGLTVLIKTYHDFKKHRENLVMFLFWMVAWSLIIVATLFPSTVTLLIERISGKGVGIGTFIGVAFIFVFFVTYRIYIKANRLEQKIKDIVVKIGLKDLDNI